MASSTVCIELVEPGLPEAPVHHVGGPHAMHQQAEPLGDDELAALVSRVRASAVRGAASAFDELAGELTEPVQSLRAG